MKIQEIVGAIIDGEAVTTDRATIDSSMTNSGQVEYISRNHAQRNVVESPSRLWRMLASAPTLFVVDNGVRFQCAR